MSRPNLKPRAFNAGHPAVSHGFIYRLFTSQRFIAIIGLIFLLLISLPLARTYSQKKVIEQELAELQANISQYENENSELQEMIQYLESDQSLESQARLNLNLKKPEETVVVIERIENKNSQTGPADLQAKDQRNNLEKWWEYFFGV